MSLNCRLVRTRLKPFSILMSLVLLCELCSWARISLPAFLFFFYVWCSWKLLCLRLSLASLCVNRTKLETNLCFLINRHLAHFCASFSIFARSSLPRAATQLGNYKFSLRQHTRNIFATWDVEMGEPFLLLCYNSQRQSARGKSMKEKHRVSSVFLFRCCCLLLLDSTTCFHQIWRPLKLFSWWKCVCIFLRFYSIQHNITVKKIHPIN